MTALDAGGVGLDPQGPAEGRPELLGLDEGADHRADVLGVDAPGEGAERFLARPPGPHLEVHPQQLLMEGILARLRLVRDARHRSVEAHPRLHAHHQQIEDVRKRVLDGLPRSRILVDSQRSGKKNAMPPNTTETGSM